MTPNDLISALNLPQDQIDRIKALKTGLDDLENILSKVDDCGNPLHTALLGKAESCMALIANITGESADTVQQTLLSLFGISDNQFRTTSPSVLEILALSALVQARNP